MQKKKHDLCVQSKTCFPCCPLGVSKQINFGAHDSTGMTLPRLAGFNAYQVSLVNSSTELPCESLWSVADNSYVWNIQKRFKIYPKPTNYLIYLVFQIHFVHVYFSLFIINITNINRFTTNRIRYEYRRHLRCRCMDTHQVLVLPARRQVPAPPAVVEPQPPGQHWPDARWAVLLLERLGQKYEGQLTLIALTGLTREKQKTHTSVSTAKPGWNKPVNFPKDLKGRKTDRVIWASYPWLKNLVWLSLANRQVTKTLGQCDITFTEAEWNKT